MKEGDPLRKFFPEGSVLTLEEYLKICSADETVNEVTQKTLVVKSAKKIPLDVEDVRSQHQLVARVIYQLILHDRSNILCNGYKIQGERLIVVSSNTAVPVLTSAPWVKLFHTIGSQKMLQLLLQCSVFCPLDHKLSYLQLCGACVGSGQLQATRPPKTQFNIRSSLHALKVCKIFKSQVLNRRPYVDTTGSVVFRFKPNFHLDTITGKNNVWRVMCVMLPLELGKMMPVYIGAKQQIVLNGERRTSLGYLVEPIIIKLLSRHSNLPYGHLVKSICSNVASADEVSQLCRTVIKRLIPFEMFGTKNNWNVINESIGQFVQLNATEQLNLSHIFEKIKISSILWLWPSKPETDEEFLRRQRILLQVLFWLFKKVLIKLIQACFHVSPSPLCYYRQDCWLERSQKSIDAYLDSTMCRIPPGRTTVLSRSRIRAVPKPNRETCRIIMDMRSANKQLEDVYQILAFEVRNNTWVKNPSDLSAMLEEYKRTYPSEGRYYLIKFDIQNAFDTIPAELAYRLASKKICSELYYIHEVKCRDTRTGRPSVYKMVSKTNEVIGNLKIRNKIIGSISNTRVVTSLQILGTLKEHLFDTEITMPRNRVYRKVQGIPQGSILSTILCNIVYDELERSIQIGEQGLLIRYVDDFLYISIDRKDCCSMLLNRLPNGSTAGAKASTAKTVTNLSDERDCIPFIGCQISTSDLRVYTTPPAINIANATIAHQLTKIRKTVHMAVSRSTTYEDALNGVLMLLDQVPSERHSFVRAVAKQAIERKYMS